MRCAAWTLITLELWAAYRFVVPVIAEYTFPTTSYLVMITVVLVNSFRPCALYLSSKSEKHTVAVVFGARVVIDCHAYVLRCAGL